MVDSKEDFIAELAGLTQQLDTVETGNSSSLFKLTLQQMTRDAQRWIDNQWITPNGDKTTAERAIQVLCQDLIVLLGHADHEDIHHKLLDDLLNSANGATEKGFIEDSTHRELFSHTPDTES